MLYLLLGVALIVFTFFLDLGMSLMCIAFAVSVGVFVRQCGGASAGSGQALPSLNQYWRSRPLALMMTSNTILSDFLLVLFFTQRLVGASIAGTGLDLDRPVKVRGHRRSYIQRPHQRSSQRPPQRPTQRPPQRPSQRPSHRPPQRPSLRSPQWPSQSLAQSPPLD